MVSLLFCKMEYSGLFSAVFNSQRASSAKIWNGAPGTNKKTKNKNVLLADWIWLLKNIGARLSLSFSVVFRNGFPRAFKHLERSWIKAVCLIHTGRCHDKNTRQVDLFCFCMKWTTVQQSLYDLVEDSCTFSFSMTFIVD